MENKAIKKRKETNKKIYLWILNYLKLNGRMPTLEELGRNFGFSRERARQRLEQLEEEGYLVKIGRKHRKSYAFTPGGVLDIIKNL